MKSEYSYYPFSPFGSLQPGRNFNAGDYRFGFNGQEKDDEVKGTGNSVDFGTRIYDSRFGRWMSTDPLQQKYPDLSPSNLCVNNPILFIDRDGKKIIIYYTVENNNPQEYIVGETKDVPNNEFVIQTIASISMIYQHPDFKVKMDDMFAVQTINFAISEGCGVHYGSSRNGSRNCDINYYASCGVVESSTGKELPPFIALFHELGHGYDIRRVMNTASQGLTGDAAYKAEKIAADTWSQISCNTNPTCYNPKEKEVNRIFENPLANFYSKLVRTSYNHGYNATFKFTSPTDLEINQPKITLVINCGGNAPAATTDDAMPEQGTVIQL